VQEGEELRKREEDFKETTNQRRGKIGTNLTQFCSGEGIFF
jgi:hypothetical protein